MYMSGQSSTVCRCHCDVISSGDQGTLGGDIQILGSHLTAALTGLGTLAQQFEDSRMEPQVISFVYVGLQSTKGGSARGGISAAKSTVLSRTLV